MIHDLVRRVITIFGAVAPDGGDAVVDALRDELTRLAPFDEGELLLTLVADVHRRSLTAQGDALVADDIVAHLSEQRGCLRIDDARHGDGHPRTCERLAQRQMRSLLAIPIVLAGNTRGVVALAARKPCGFSGAPLPPLISLASAAGLALTQSLKLSGLSDENERLRQERDRLSRAVAEGEQATLDARCESEARAAEREATRRALDSLERNRETQSGTRQLQLVVKPEARDPAAGNAPEAAKAAPERSGATPKPVAPPPACEVTAPPKPELRARPIPPAAPKASSPTPPPATQAPAAAKPSHADDPVPPLSDGPGRPFGHGNRRRRR